MAFPGFRAEAYEVTDRSERSVTLSGYGQVILLQHPVDLPQDGGLCLGNMCAPGIEPVTQDKFIGVKPIRQRGGHVSADTGRLETFAAPAARQGLGRARAESETDDAAEVLTRPTTCYHLCLGVSNKGSAIVILPTAWVRR